MLTDVVDTTDLKNTFAFHLLMKHGDVMAAATATVPDNMQFRLHVAKYWPEDVYVLIRKRELVAEHGAEFFLPDKYDIAHTIMSIVERAIHAEDKLKGLKQAAELLGMIEKPGATVNVTNNQVTNKVLVVERFGKNEDWEQAALAQQTQLLIEAGG